MNKITVIAIAICLTLGISLIVASKINPTTLFIVGVVSIILGILLIAYVLYQNYNKN